MADLPAPSEMHELPRPACIYADHSYPAFTAEQMHEYARAYAERLAVDARKDELLASAAKLLERCGPHLQGVEQECCGNYESDYGGEYMGQREVVPVCCGQAIDLSDHVANELRCIRAALGKEGDPLNV